jgi:glycosyltransferase involved in cell wall biosynthesis
LYPFTTKARGVECFYQAICLIFDQLPILNFEGICVDDGSHDDTLKKLIALVRRDPFYNVVELSRNFGKETALSAGIDTTMGDAIIPNDADFQDSPELIPAPDTGMSTRRRRCACP